MKLVVNGAVAYGGDLLGNGVIHATSIENSTPIDVDQVRADMLQWSDELSRQSTNGTTNLVGSIQLVGTDPVLKQHVHTVVLFPYFDESGVFRLVVMERNSETGISSLKNRYAADHIHLVRLPAFAGYTPPTLNFEHY